MDAFIVKWINCFSESTAKNDEKHTKKSINLNSCICKKFVDKSLILGQDFQILTRIQKMLNNLNCPGFIVKCIECSEDQLRKDSIILQEDTDGRYEFLICQNSSNLFSNLSDFKSNLAYHFVMMYDKCTKKVSYDSLEHVICSEIRAFNLSGQCAWYRNMIRKFKQNVVSFQNLAFFSEQKVFYVCYYLKEMYKKISISQYQTKFQIFAVIRRAYQLNHRDLLSKMFLRF